MANDKDDSHIGVSTDVDNKPDNESINLSFQESNNNSLDSSSAEIKQQAGELLRVAGEFAGSIGKLAVRQGVAIKDKLEDEEIQEKINANIKVVTDKIDDFVNSDSAKNRRVINVKGGVDSYPTISVSNSENETNKKTDRQKSAIEMDIEVEGNETVDFQTDSVNSEKQGLIAKFRSAREEKKAELERLRREEEERKQKQKTQSLLVGLLVMCLCFAMMIIPDLRHDKKSDYVDPESGTEETVYEETEDSEDMESEGGSSTDEQEKLIEDTLDKDNPTILYGEDIKVSDKESYDFGYVEVRARVAAHYNDGPWDLIVLDSNGSEDTSGYIRNVGLESGVPDEYKTIFDECSSNHQEEENYIFTLRGNASWRPMKEGSSGGNTGFRFDIDKIMKIEYIPYED